MTKKLPNAKRAYPAVYERIIPIALGVLAVIIFVMLLFTILVGVGVFSFS